MSLKKDMVRVRRGGDRTTKVASAGLTGGITRKPMEAAKESFIDRDIYGESFIA